MSPTCPQFVSFVSPLQRSFRAGSIKSRRQRSAHSFDILSVSRSSSIQHHRAASVLLPRHVRVVLLPTVWSNAAARGSCAAVTYSRNLNAQPLGSELEGDQTATLGRPGAKASIVRGSLQQVRLGERRNGCPYGSSLCSLWALALASGGVQSSKMVLRCEARGGTSTHVRLDILGHVSENLFTLDRCMKFEY